MHQKDLKMIQKFKKKPVEIEAIQLTESTIIESFQFVFGEKKFDFESTNSIEDLIKKIGGFSIPTKEGNMKVSFGDYIIREPFPSGDRQFYPCKPDIFEKTYENLK